MSEKNVYELKYLIRTQCHTLIFEENKLWERGTYLQRKENHKTQLTNSWEDTWMDNFREKKS